MDLTRRTFMKMTAGSLVACSFGGLGISLAEAAGQVEIAKLKATLLTTTICSYCSVGCGILVHTSDNGKGIAVNMEGDPDHPINEGALCPKGASLRQLTDNHARPTTPLYRAPGSAEWKEVDWDWAIKEIAKKVKATRDATFVAKNDKGETVNRTDGIVSFGSAAMDNEDCWTYQAFLRSLGLAAIESQARL